MRARPMKGAKVHFAMTKAQARLAKTMPSTGWKPMRAKPKGETK
jgi:hypothetical protein